MLPKEVNSELTPEENEPCRELRGKCSDRGNSMCKGPDIGTKVAWNGASERMTVSR